MFEDHSIATITTPRGATIRVNVVKHKGGINDSGWWIVRADTTGEILKVPMKDVNDSRILEGGEILERFDKDVHTEDEVNGRMEELIAANP